LIGFKTKVLGKPLHHFKFPTVMVHRSCLRNGLSWFLLVVSFRIPVC